MSDDEFACVCLCGYLCCLEGSGVHDGIGAWSEGVGVGGFVEEEVDVADEFGE